MGRVRWLQCSPGFHPCPVQPAASYWVDGIIRSLASWHGRLLGCVALAWPSPLLSLTSRLLLNHDVSDIAIWAPQHLLHVQYRCMWMCSRYSWSSCTPGGTFTGTGTCKFLRCWFWPAHGFLLLLHGCTGGPYKTPSVHVCRFSPAHVHLLQYLDEGAFAFS